MRHGPAGQSIENQLRELRAVAKHRRWQLVETNRDDAVRGAKGAEKRPAFDRMRNDAKHAKFDLVAASSVDRLGRSLSDLIAFLAELHAVKVDLFLLKQATDTTTPAGRMLFGVLGVFAEFEREIIAERTRAGMARARAAGKRIGRPPLSDDALVSIAALARRGLSNRAIAAKVGVSEASVRRLRKAA